MACCAKPAPLEECEEFALDGVTYEAFNTSGGLGTLCETLDGKVRNLNYRTIRYPGHAAIMKALLNDLRLRDRRELLKDILEKCRAGHPARRGHRLRHGSGLRNGHCTGNLCQQDLRRAEWAAESQRHPDHHSRRHLRRARYAEQRAGCASAAVRQEDIDLSDFLANRFGAAYATAETAAAIRAAAPTLVAVA